MKEQHLDGARASVEGVIVRAWQNDVLVREAFGSQRFVEDTDGLSKIVTLTGHEPQNEVRILRSRSPRPLDERRDLRPLDGCLERTDRAKSGSMGEACDESDAPSQAHAIDPRRSCLRVRRSFPAYAREQRLDQVPAKGSR